LLDAFASAIDKAERIARRILQSIERMPGCVQTSFAHH